MDQILQCHRRENSENFPTLSDFQIKYILRMCIYIEINELILYWEKKTVIFLK